MKEVFVRFIPLPLSVHAFTLMDEQGDYNIYINSLLSDEQKQKSYCHEKLHIERDDFCIKGSAVEIEKNLRTLTGHGG